ncbi:MAG: ChaN family lipoprotein [Verrucomicrobiota bacterium]
MKTILTLIILTQTLTWQHLAAERTDSSMIKCSLWIDLYHGEVTTYEGLIDDLNQARVVYLGETHRIKRHHQWQVRILESLRERGNDLILGLEQIESKYQNEVEAYNVGELSYEAFAKKINWEKTWKNYEDYEDLVTYAQTQEIPIVALNADAKIIRKIGREGLQNLDPLERDLLPKIINWEKDPIYRQWLNKILMVHMPVTEEKLMPFFQAQVSRDEMMSEQLVKFLKLQAEGTIALVITGSGHVNYGLGMVQRVNRRLGSHKKRILLFSESQELILTDEEKAMSREISMTHDDLDFIKSPIANYLLATEIGK